LGLDEKTIEIVRKWRFKPAMGYAGRAAKLFLIATAAVAALTAVLFFWKNLTRTRCRWRHACLWQFWA